jgi:hypothetical protein
MPQKSKAERQSLAKSQTKERIQTTGCHYGLRKGGLNYAMALVLAVPCVAQHVRRLVSRSL